MSTGGLATRRVSSTHAFIQLLRHWTERDFHSRYASSALSAVWAVLQPFCFVSVYVLIFGVILQQSSEELPFLTYLLSGVVVFRVVASALAASGCFVDNLGVITHASFPRAVIPISQVLGNLLDVAVTSSALLVVARFQGVALSSKVVLLPLVLSGVVVFAAAVCVLASTAQVFVRDLQFVIVFASMGMFFASPITYPVEQLPTWLTWLEWANPVSVFVRALRAVTLLGTWPDGWFWAHFAGAGVLLVAAILHLRSVEHRIVDLG